jgi:hypothetical protein
VRLHEEKHDVDDYEKAQRLRISRATAMKKCVRKLSGLSNQELEGAKKFRIEVSESVDGVLEEMTDRIIFRRQLFFAALRTEPSSKRSAAVAALSKRQHP